MDTEARFISPTAGYFLLFLFAVAMLLITQVFAKWRDSDTREGFLVAGRNLGWLLGGSSIAASWIWAPALFISSQIAYEKGMAGLFWFIVPNMAALAIFAFLGPAIRKKMPAGFTLPQYIKHRYNSDRVHKLYIFAYMYYEVMAVTVQLFAGGNFVSLLTGIPLVIVMPILAIIALAYTWISGLEASVVTDFVQMALIYTIGVVIIPMVYMVAGGAATLSSGLAGISGSTNVFEPEIAFSFGIVTAIGLISGSICDQQYWQRSFAIAEKSLKKAFLFGALLFGLVPLGLSLLGFIAASPATSVVLPEGIDVSLIGVQTVATLLPSWAVCAFVVMLLCGLSSTIDSGLMAAGSLWVTDIAQGTDDTSAVRGARYAMVGISIVGLLIALLVIYVPGFGLMHLWWVMNSIASCLVVPTVLSLFVDKVNERGVSIGILLSFMTGVPMFIYGSVLANPGYIVGASFYILLVSLFCCLFVPAKES